MPDRPLLFKLRRSPEASARADVRRVGIEFDGVALEVPAGITLAAALLATGWGHFRATPVSQAPRAPLCMMGVCFDCLLEVDGVPNRQACMTAVREGMRVRRQLGARPYRVDDER